MSTTDFVNRQAAEFQAAHSAREGWTVLRGDASRSPCPIKCLPAFLQAQAPAAVRRRELTTAFSYKGIARVPRFFLSSPPSTSSTASPARRGCS